MQQVEKIKIKCKSRFKLTQLNQTSQDNYRQWASFQKIKNIKAIVFINKNQLIHLSTPLIILIIIHIYINIR